ncbi:MAG: hypothetical protein JWQ43_2490 [Glaciihabitans sp.]|nr:hypothetical protein [Glaciihabitans sp.]
MKLTVTDNGDGTIVVQAAAVELLRYVYVPTAAQSESPRPYFHPIRSLAGDVLTGYRPDDHVWHAGLSLALPGVGPYNFWGGPSFRRGLGYVQLENNGVQRHLSVSVSDDGFTEELIWLSPAGSIVLTETRHISVRERGDSWVLLLDFALLNESGDALTFGSPATEGRENAGYGGLFWRGAESLLDGTIFVPGGAATEAAMGSREPWMAYATPTATIVMVDSGSNPRHPTPWFVRSSDYAGLCPAPFFSTELDLDAGETLALRYAVVFATGDSDHGRAVALADFGRESLNSALRE